MNAKDRIRKIVILKVKLESYRRYLFGHKERAESYLSDIDESLDIVKELEKDLKRDLREDV